MKARGMRFFGGQKGGRNNNNNTLDAEHTVRCIQYIDRENRPKGFPINELTPDADADVCVCVVRAIWLMSAKAIK